MGLAVLMPVGNQISTEWTESANAKDLHDNKVQKAVNNFIWNDGALSASETTVALGKAHRGTAQERTDKLICQDTCS
jgi:hypothetical protein